MVRSVPGYRRAEEDESSNGDRILKKMVEGGGEGYDDLSQVRVQRWNAID